MSDKRFWFGVTVSALWTLAAVCLLLLKFSDLGSMTPNAWGDFFAGFSAPLAFLWLVLGYMQQGEELRLSTKALHLQAEELRNSVEQQRALVEVTRQQVESEREALAEELRSRDAATKPNFIVAQAGSSFRADGEATYVLIFSNTGNMASNVVAVLTSHGGLQTRLIDMPVFDRGHQHKANLNSPHPIAGSDTRLSITYKDALGRPCDTTFAVSRQTEHPHSDLRFTRVEA